MDELSKRDAMAVHIFLACVEIRRAVWSRLAGSMLAYKHLDLGMRE